MIRSIKSLIGYTMGAIDGEIGKVKEFYFDDETWAIRYLIVETGSWLFGRKVLISPEALLTPDWNKGIFPVNLTIQQIENSPNIDTEELVSRQQEMELHKHYLWTNYWDGIFHDAALPIIKYDVSHLRSLSEITKCHLNANKVEVGYIEDFLIDDTTWKVNFMVVDAVTWSPAKKVLISPKLIKEINWHNSSATTKASMEKIKNSPEYNTGQTISEADKVVLNDYYESAIL